MNVKWHRKSNPFFSWLVNFLTSRQLTKPDKRPLYEYHTSHHEYESLKQLITSNGSSEEFATNTDAAACFILFCSEWYRREYAPQYGWSWDPIWQLLHFQVDPIDLGKVVNIGLENYWERPISIYESERRNLLGSVFSEGGLPFLSLKETGNRFQNLFSRILRAYDSYQGLGYSTEKLVLDMVKKAGLPQIFQDSTSIDLLASMAKELILLVSYYELAEKENPVNTLDRLQPKWRERFPLPLDIETGKELISSLLSSASKEIKTKEEKRGKWSCSHYINKNDMEQLFTAVELPNEIFFHSTKKLPSSRLELALFEGANLLSIIGACYAQEDGDGIRTRGQLKSVTLKRFEPELDLRLVALFNGAEIAELVVPNSTVGLKEVPLGFILKDEAYVLVGQASFRVKESPLLLLVPEGAEIIVERGSYSVEEEILGCVVYKVSETTRLRVTHDETFTVALDESATTQAQIDLHGKVVDWPSKPGLTYLGIPKSVLSDESIEADSLGLELFISGQSYSNYIFNTYGSHYVSVRNEQGEALLRRKIGILPPDFHLEIESGRNPNEGVIWIQTIESGHYEILDSDLTQQTEYYTENYTGLSLKSDGQPPSHVQVQLRFGAAEPIVLTVPFPSSGFLAFNAAGVQLPRELSITELLGTRLYLFGRAQSTFTIYHLALTLKGEKRLNLYHEWQVQVESQPIEISLFSLKEQIEPLLSLQRGIDRYVELTVNNQLVCRISRYAVNLVLDLKRGRITFRGIEKAHIDLPKPILFSLVDPEQSPVALKPHSSEGVEFEDYDIPTNLDPDTPYLIAPAEASSINFRPELIMLSSKTHLDLALPNTQNIRQAVRAFDPNNSLNPLDAVVEAMSKDAGHSGWHYLRTIYDNYGYLPLATFEAWLALMRNPRAIAMALFKFEMSEDFITRLESRFPFAWESFPIINIAKVEYDFFKDLRKKGLSDEMAITIKQNFYERLAMAIPVYSGPVNMWLKTQRISAETRSAQATIEYFISIWYQDLITQHSSSDWPDFKGEALKEWLRSQTNLHFLDAEVESRNTIVYFPFFAAAIAAEKVDYREIFSSESEMIFYLRQVRVFDLEWFNAVYQYALLTYLDK